MGHGGPSLYAPDYLLDHDVILVSGNYRLGVLGFMGLGTADSPGNYGLKDQVLLLQWVRNNIAAFNGDPEMVTIFGESAGSISVNYHLIAPASEKLFHRAILQSGTIINDNVLTSADDQMPMTAVLGVKLGCSLGNEKDYADFVACQRERPAVDVVKAAAGIARNRVNEPVRLYGAVVEPAADDAFITKQPSEYMRPHGLDKPIMIGYTAQEGAIKAVGESSKYLLFSFH